MLYSEEVNPTVEDPLMRVQKGKPDQRENDKDTSKAERLHTVKGWKNPR